MLVLYGWITNPDDNVICNFIAYDRILSPIFLKHTTIVSSGVYMSPFTNKRHTRTYPNSYLKLFKLAYRYSSFGLVTPILLLCLTFKQNSIETWLLSSFKNLEGGFIFILKHGERVTQACDKCSCTKLNSTASLPWYTQLTFFLVVTHLTSKALCMVDFRMLFSFGIEVRLVPMAVSINRQPQIIF